MQVKPFETFKRIEGYELRTAQGRSTDRKTRSRKG